MAKLVVRSMIFQQLAISMGFEDNYNDTYICILIRDIKAS